MTRYALARGLRAETRSSVRPALRLHAAIAVVLFGLVAVFVNEDFPLPSTADYGGPAALEGWFRYDGVWYQGIAEDGYFFRGDAALSSVAFFPVYPLTMRGLHWLFGGDYVVWGVMITRCFRGWRPRCCFTAGAFHASVKAQRGMR